MGFLFIENKYFNIPLEIIWNIHVKSFPQKGTYLLTSARGKFGCGRWPKILELTVEGSRIDGGHNVVCDIDPNVAVLDISLRRGDVA